MQVRVLSRLHRLFRALQQKKAKLPAVHVWLGDTLFLLNVAVLFDGLPPHVLAIQKQQLLCPHRLDVQNTDTRFLHNRA